MGLIKWGQRCMQVSIICHLQMISILNFCQFGPSPLWDAWKTTHETRNLNGSGWNDDFHLFQLFWSPDFITFSVDNEVIKTVYTDSGYWNKGNFDKNLPNTPNPWVNGKNDAPFDQEFFFIINLAVGGKSFFPDQAVSTYRDSIHNSY